MINQLNAWSDFVDYLLNNLTLTIILGALLLPTTPPAFTMSGLPQN